MSTDQSDGVHYKVVKCLLCRNTIDLPSDLVGVFKLCGSCIELSESERRARIAQIPSLHVPLAEQYV